MAKYSFQAEADWGEIYQYDHNPTDDELLRDFKGCGGDLDGIDVWGDDGLVRDGNFKLRELARSALKIRRNWGERAFQNMLDSLPSDIRADIAVRVKVLDAKGGH